MFDWSEVLPRLFEYRAIGLLRRVFANGPRDRGSIPYQIIPKTQKMILCTALLNTQHYMGGSKVKWSNPGKEVAPSPIPPCGSYWKGSPRVTLDEDRQLHSHRYLVQHLYELNNMIFFLISKRKRCNFFEV